MEHLVNQPKPQFTLDDLAELISKTYTATMTAAKCGDTEDTERNNCLREANGYLQELVATVDKHKRDFQGIEPKLLEAEQSVSKAIANSLGEEKVQFYVAGVQLIENKVIVGTSLYSTMIKAKKIRDMLNAKFAELRVDHEAKILNYPVF